LIELNELSPYGYGIFLFSPDKLTEFLKTEKCRAMKLCSYFDKNKEIFHKAIANGIVLPVYRISVFKYALFVTINESGAAAPDGWEQVFKYDDFFIQVGNSNKLCWMSFDTFEHSKTPIDKRQTNICQVIPHGGKGVMLPVYQAVDVDIPQGYYRFDLIAYKRTVPLDESITENYGRNYAYGYNFRSTDTTLNENLIKGDNEKTNFDIHSYLSK
jgi:hypothetical protein